MFTLVFLPGLGAAALRPGLGWGPLPGTIAALLVLADAGAYREGGWIYTVTYGVWPQALATSLAWLAFAELALAPRETCPSGQLTPPLHRTTCPQGRLPASAPPATSRAPPSPPPAPCSPTRWRS
jgi:hypothetical protein